MKKYAKYEENRHFSSFFVLTFYQIVFEHFDQIWVFFRQYSSYYEKYALKFIVDQCELWYKGSYHLVSEGPKIWKNR